MNVYALDCEMVGTLSGDMIARVTIVNKNGVTLLDHYVKPTSPVTDYRTFVSGVRESDLKNALNRSQVRKMARSILDGNIVVGHSLKKDLMALKLGHPRKDRRDLAKYPPLMVGGQPQSLKTLARLYLGRNIQEGEHDSVEDAKASMDIYLKLAAEWERSLV